MEKSHWEPKVVAISLGLKWDSRVGNGYLVGQYSSDLPNVAGEGIRWHGMLFASLPLDSYIVMSKSFLWMDKMSCLQIAVTGAYVSAVFHWPFPISLGCLATLVDLFAGGDLTVF